MRNPNGFTISNVTFTNNGNYAIGTDGNTNLNVATLTATGNGSGARNAIAHRSNATISGTERWRAAGIPWAVTSTTDVGPTGTLTIDPGVTVKVDNNQALMVAGSLTANGTAALPITFTSNAATPTAGSWQSLYFKPGATGTISHATVAYSGWGGWGSFRIESASPVIDHVTVTNSGSRSVLVTGNGSPRFRHCAFVNPPVKGIENQGSGQVDAVLNYWGATDGPAGPPAKGTGASVSWNVAYEPWLEVAPTTANYVDSVIVQNRTFNPTLSALPTITAAGSATGAWTLRIINSTNSVVRTYTGSGASTSITWDGKDESGALLSAARYAYSIDTTATGGGIAATARGALILTSATYLPATTLTLTQNQVLSNVYQNGSTNIAIIGTAADPNLNNWILDYGAGAAPGSWITLMTGTTNVQNAQFVLLPTLPLTNGPYVIRLRAWDKDGRYTETPVSVSVQNFKVSQSASQVNATNGTLTYTSVVPFTLTETLVIKDSNGSTIRTLVNASRAANTYNDAWNVRNDANQMVPDGGYFYVATVTDGTHTMTWDLTVGFTPTLREVTHATISGLFDPFNNQPLTISYNWPAARRTYIAVSNNPAEISCSPPYYCITEGAWDESGPHSMQWVGVDSSGAFRANTRTNNYIARVSYDFAPSGAVVFGTKPTISNLRTTPPVFSPAFGSPTVVSFTLGTFQGASAAVTVRFINQTSVSTLRTLSLPSQSPGLVSITWNGLADNGMKVAPGTYTVEVTATDPIGNTVKDRVLATIQY